MSLTLSTRPDRTFQVIAVLLALLVPSRPGAAGNEIRTDLLVVGGTESGCAAAVQAARMGVRKIVLVNDITWLGGQFSAEALVAIDENRNPSGYGHGVPFPRSGLFKEVMDRIEERNVARYGRARPGNTRVITTCRPADAERAFRELLAPYVESGQVRLIAEYVPIHVERDGNRVTSVRFRSSVPGERDLTVLARMTIDASDWGDVIKDSGAEYEFGPDLREKYAEPQAPTSHSDYPTTDMNPITYCMVIEETDKLQPIPKPRGYDARNYRNHGYPTDPQFLYDSRRVVDHYNYREIQAPDVLLLCFPAFDYPLDVLPRSVADRLEVTEPGAAQKNIVQMNREQRRIVFDDAKQYALGFLYYLQTEVHDAMEDKAHSFRRFRLVDEFGTADHLPPKPYVRESLRLKAMHMMRQQDTMGHGDIPENFARVMYHDGVASWQFVYDFHPTHRKFLDEDDPSGPWTTAFRRNRTWGPPYSGRCLFPLRSMVPETIDGLIGAQKSLGFSSIVSSAVRLHDQSMAIGQAAGATAAICLLHDCQPRRIPFDRGLLGEVWRGLVGGIDGGVPQTLWPFRDVGPEHPAFAAINLLAAYRAFPLECDDVDFRPDEPASESWKREVVDRSLKTRQVEQAPVVSVEPMTRADFAIRWWSKLQSLPDRPFPRLLPDDADGDGTPDRLDALPFRASDSSWPPYTLPADQDGNPDLSSATGADERRFNFCGIESPPIDGWQNDNGQAYSPERRFGWNEDITTSHRRRNRLKGDWRDTFVFTRAYNRWECELANGRYRVTVCVGDSAFPQEGQNVAVAGKPIVNGERTAIGRYLERSTIVDIVDHRLAIEIGTQGGTTNTCLNWLTIVRIE